MWSTTFLYTVFVQMIFAKYEEQFLKLVLMLDATFKIFCMYDKLALTQKDFLQYWLFW